MTLLPVEKKERKYSYGITPYAIALVYEEKTRKEDRDVFHADNPSVYAEARLGVASRTEAKEAFEKLIYEIIFKNCKTDLPMLRQWLTEAQGELITFEDLEQRIQTKNKAMALTAEAAVSKKPSYDSSQGTLSMMVRSRSNATAEDTLSYWKVTMGNFEISERGLNQVFWRNCQCGIQGETANKRRLWAKEGEEKEYLDDLLEKRIVMEKDIERPLHLVCYHEAAAATELELQNNRGKRQTIPRLKGKETIIPFDFINRWDLVFEAMVRKYKYRQDMAEIDAYLWQHDIMSPKFKEYMKQGIIHKEVIKSRRVFDSLSKKIIQEIYTRMHENGYKYKGLSREFIGFANKRKNYECIGIVFEKEEPDISYRVVYAPESGITIPFIVEKRYFDPDIRQPKPIRYQRSPLRLWVEQKKLNTIDDRADRVAEITVHMPSEHVLTRVQDALNQEQGVEKKNVKKEYNRLRDFFLAHQPR